MRRYEVNGWRLEFPDHWLTERDQEDGHLLFYPPDSSLTVHVTSFHLEKEGVLAPAAVVRQIYRASLAQQGGQDSAPIPWTGPLPRDFTAETFEDREDAGAVCRICLGVYGPGELLSVNVYGETLAQCRQALDYFKALGRA